MCEGTRVLTVRMHLKKSSVVTCEAKSRHHLGFCERICFEKLPSSLLTLVFFVQFANHAFPSATVEKYT